MVGDDGAPALPPPPGFRWEGILLVPEFIPEAGDAPEGEMSRIDALLANETCPICRRLLLAIDKLEGQRREQALSEYADFKAAMDGEHATEDDIKRVFEESPMLEHVLIDRLGVEELGVKVKGD